MSSEKIKSIFENFDKEKSGKLDKNNFVNLVKENTTIEYNPIVYDRIINIQNHILEKEGREYYNLQDFEKVYNHFNKPLNVAIIGGGCAGLTSAIYAGRAELEPVLFAGGLEDKGGLLVKTSIVENFPGFPEGILGFDLVENMEKQAVNCGATIINKNIVKVDFSKRPFTLTDHSGNVYLTKSVIIATGSKPLKLGLDNEENLWSKGISSCAVCDGALYKKKAIVVVGGGDSAMEEALFLTKFSNVTLIHRRDTFRASKIMVKRVLENPKIKILYDSVVDKLNGTNKLESIVVKNLKTNEKTEMNVNGLFYGLGLKPNTYLFKGLVEMDEDGYIQRSNKKFETMTSVEGVFVAGDSHDKVYRQAVVASGDGCKAALDVNQFLNEEEE